MKRRGFGAFPAQNGLDTSHFWPTPGPTRPSPGLVQGSHLARGLHAPQHRASDLGWPASQEARGPGESEAQQQPTGGRPAHRFAPNLS